VSDGEPCATSWSGFDFTQLATANNITSVRLVAGNYSASGPHDLVLRISGSYTPPGLGTQIYSYNVTGYGTYEGDHAFWDLTLLTGWTKEHFDNATSISIEIDNGESADFEFFGIEIVHDGGVPNSYQLEVLGDSPYLYWPLNETSGTTVNDLSGNDNHGTLVNTPVLDEEAPFSSSGPSIHLNQSSTNEYIRSDQLPDFPNTNITIEMWTKPDSFTTPSQFTFFNYGDGNEIIFIKLGSGSSEWSFYRGPGYAMPNSTGTIQTGQWQHLVLQWRNSDGQMRMFVNGNLVSTRSSSTTATIPQNEYFIVGQEQDGTLGGFDTRRINKGRVAHVAIYDDYLTASQIQNHYEAAVPPTGNAGILVTLSFLPLV
jgi:hypothetical protein